MRVEKSDTDCACTRRWLTLRPVKHKNAAQRAKFEYDDIIPIPNLKG